MRLSASAPSSHDLSLAAFTINIAESNFRHTQVTNAAFRASSTPSNASVISRPAIACPGHSTSHGLRLRLSNETRMVLLFTGRSIAERVPSTTFGEHRQLVARRATYDHKKRRMRHVLFLAVIPRRSWKRRLFLWWAHQGSNLGPAD